MLDTCGQYFDRGSSRKRLDAFLVFFQVQWYSRAERIATLARASMAERVGRREAFSADH